MKASVSIAFWGTSNKQQLRTGKTLLSAQGAGSNLQRALVLRPQHQSSAASPLWPSCQCPGTGRSSLGPASHQSAAPLLGGTRAHQAEPPAGVGDPPRPAPHTDTHTHVMLSAACSILGPMFCKRCIFMMPIVLNTFLAFYAVNKHLCIWYK